jgi:hypothetical protein
VTLFEVPSAVSRRDTGEGHETYILQLLHGRLVGLASAQQVWAMAVAVLGVGRFARGVDALGIVLLRDVLGEVGRNHLADLLRLLLVGVLGAVGVQVPRPLGHAFMVMSTHQGGVRVDRSTRDIAGERRRHGLGAPGGAPPSRSAGGRLGEVVLGCDIDGVRGVSRHLGRRLRIVRRPERPGRRVKAAPSKRQHRAALSFPDPRCGETRARCELCGESTRFPGLRSACHRRRATLSDAATTGAGDERVGGREYRERTQKSTIVQRRCFWVGAWGSRCVFDVGWSPPSRTLTMAQEQHAIARNLLAWPPDVAGTSEQVLFYRFLFQVALFTARKACMHDYSDVLRPASSLADYLARLLSLGDADTNVNPGQPCQAEHGEGAISHQTSHVQHQRVHPVSTWKQDRLIQQ